MSIKGGGIFKKPLDFSALNLSDAQKQQIREIRSANGGRAKQMQNNLKDQRDQMRDMMFDPNASDDQVRAKRRDVRQLQERIEEMQINDFLAIRKVLTPEQRQRLSDLNPSTARVAGNNPEQADAVAPAQRGFGQ
jgi:Spy/CpxP family protein refolding chaperone